MQFTATKLCTAFLALIALMQFVSGATLYSEMTPEITVGVSGVALADGCAPTVSGLFSLSSLFFVGFENFLLLGRRVYVVGLETKTSRAHRE
jgi:hypothetical protein|tara:strand:+ start:69 stop:344 length:276 start_codon:yes stop_codon:yes gene_type:complete